MIVPDETPLLRRIVTSADRKRHDIVMKSAATASTSRSVGREYDARPRFSRSTSPRNPSSDDSGLISNRVPDSASSTSRLTRSVRSRRTSTLSVVTDVASRRTNHCAAENASSASESTTVDMVASGTSRLCCTAPSRNGRSSGRSLLRGSSQTPVITTTVSEVSRSLPLAPTRWSRWPTPRPRSSAKRSLTAISMGAPGSDTTSGLEPWVSEMLSSRSFSETNECRPTTDAPPTSTSGSSSATSNDRDVTIRLVTRTAEPKVSWPLSRAVLTGSSADHERFPPLKRL